MARGTRNQTAPVQEDAVTEIQNTEATEGQENETVEAGTVEGGHTFNEGDEASVIRGKLRGRKGVILAYSAAEETYAIKLDGGTLATVNAKNLKAPQDSTISVRALVAALAGFGQEAGTPDRDAAVRLATMLDEVAPGTSVKLNESFAS